jgi:membrane protease YdiL (CAAX protease family)
MTELNQSLVSDRPPITSIFFILLVMLIGFLFVGPAIGLGVASLFYEGDLLTAIQAGTSDRSMFLPLMILQGITSLIGLIVGPLILLWFIEHKKLAPFFRREKDVTKIFAMIPVLGICFYIAISPVTEWNMNFHFPEFLKGFDDWARGMEKQMMEMTKLLTNFNTTTELIIGLLVIAVIPGIGEELVFRGLIQNELFRSSKNIHIAIWTSAFLFSAIHMQFFGFVPRLFLGAFFGYLYYWSGNLLIPMVAHFFHNGFTLIMIHLYNQGSSTINMDTEESAPMYLVALCVGVTFVLLYFFRKHYIEQPPS